MMKIKKDLSSGLNKDRTASLQKICAIVYSLLLLTGIAVCTVCDLAITGSFSWSLYPIYSIALAWLVVLPVIRFGRKGIVFSMLALSVFIFPYLYLLNTLIRTQPLFLPIAIRTASISIVFLWGVFALFTVLKAKKLLASAITCVLVIPVWIFINVTISNITLEPQIDLWDISSFFILLLAAGVLFAAHCMERKKQAA